MGQELSELNDLRGQIDKIDDELQDLLIRRSELSRAIAGVKLPDGGKRKDNFAHAMRPAREASIIRRLIARHRGELPPQAIARVFREIISASLRIQSKFELHVLAGTEFFDIARSGFGSLAPIRIHAKPSLVVHACAENLNSLGLVSLPEFEEPGASWWAQLAPAGTMGPRVIAKLPFVTDNADAPSALAIGAIELAPSGDDMTFLLLQIEPGMSRNKLLSFVKTAGFDAARAAAGRISDKMVPDEILLSVKGFVTPDDDRLKVLAKIAGDAVVRIAQIGGYANPVMVKAPARPAMG